MKTAGGADTEVLSPSPFLAGGSCSAFIHFTLAANTYTVNAFNVPSAKLQMLKPVLHFIDEETAYLTG